MRYAGILVAFIASMLVDASAFAITCDTDCNAYSKEEWTCGYSIRKSRPNKCSVTNPLKKASCETQKTADCAKNKIVDWIEDRFAEDDGLGPQIMHDSSYMAPWSPGLVSASDSIGQNPNAGTTLQASMFYSTDIEQTNYSNTSSGDNGLLCPIDRIKNNIKSREAYGSAMMRSFSKLFMTVAKAHSLYARRHIRSARCDGAIFYNFGFLISMKSFALKETPPYCRTMKDSLFVLDSLLSLQEFKDENGELNVELIREKEAYRQIMEKIAAIEHTGNFKERLRAFQMNFENALGKKQLKQAKSLFDSWAAFKASISKDIQNDVKLGSKEKAELSLNLDALAKREAGCFVVPRQFGDPRPLNPNFKRIGTGRPPKPGPQTQSTIEVRRPASRKSDLSQRKRALLSFFFLS